MGDDISFQHGNHFVEVKAGPPPSPKEGAAAHPKPARVPGVLLTVYVDGRPLGNLPHREMEAPIDTEERARRLINRKLGRGQ